MIRAIAILAVIVLACVANFTLVPHHEAGEIFETLHMHVVPATLEVDGETLGFEAPAILSAFTMNKDMEPTGFLPFLNLQLFQLAAVLLILIAFSGVSRSIRTGEGDYVSRLFAGFCLWIRDEMVVPVMGKQMGTKFLPYFLAVFFFLIFMNLMGLVPGSATPTANIGVTAAMAVLTFIAMVVCGMVIQGPLHFWKNLLPHGIPLVLLPLMFLIELVGLIVKPVALTIRLFANLLAGHLIVLSVMGLIFLAGSASAVIGWASAPLVVAFAVFIMIIESFVACLQAYIFTYLSIIFVQMCIHPDH